MTVTTTAADDRLPVLPHLEVQIGDDLDIASLPSLRHQLEDAVRLRPERLVIDFSACRYIDAQAIRLLVEAHGGLWGAGGRLVLKDCSPETTRLLSLAGVLEIFELEGASAGGQASTK
jgi:anti-anti-sigma factor